MKTIQCQRINAGYILPVTAPVIHKGSILIKNGEIEFVGRSEDCPNDSTFHISDCPDHLLMPGLVNAHAHLSLTGLEHKIQKGTSFTDWIMEVIPFIRSMSEAEENESIKKGIEKLIETGTTTIGDISREGCSVKILREMKVRGTVLLEIIGFKQAMKEDQINKAQGFLKRFKNDGFVSPGLSPHSPYGVSPQLIQQIYHLAEENKLPVAIHVAESDEESEFIKTGEGSLKELLVNIDRWESGWKPQGVTPVRYLENLESLNGITGVHLNNATDEDIQILKKNNVSAVYCPKSNQWFNRKKVYPLMKFLDNEINVAIGTDSLASNDSLNMFEEINLIKKQFPEIRKEILLEMATVNGARALKIEEITGDLRVGKKADLLCLKVANDDIYESLFSSDRTINFSMVEGERIFHGTANLNQK